MASGFRRAMDASNRFDFGLDSRMNVNGFDYAGDRMDRGLPDFPIQFLGGSGTSSVGGNVSSVCTTTDVLAWPLSYGGPLLGPRVPPGTRVDSRNWNGKRTLGSNAQRLCCEQMFAKKLKTY